MKSKFISTLSVVALLLVASFSVASAQGAGQGNDNAGVKKADAQTEMNGKNDDNGNTDSVTSTNREMERNTDNATSTNPNRETERNTDNATSTNANGNGKFTAETHRSAVASFVQSLLSVADSEEEGIGEQVRVIARAQNDSVATTTSAIERVQSRNALKTFLIGSDYKNLGVLKSEISNTEDNLDQLKTLLANTTDATDQAVITDQIQALEKVQTNIKNFVAAKESSFSLFGWFAKLFAE